MLLQSAGIDRGGQPPPLVLRQLTPNITGERICLVLLARQPGRKD